ncbi:MAG: leucine-rich repeat domain-containing protein, partial [Ruminiclostridium sp.]|nr:leucine-rich repeat domain-containing protein [Ruminiclostridium sp.]
FDLSNLNKSNIIKDLIYNNLSDSLRLTEEMGWLDNIKRRDELIKYAQDNNRPECTAFLLDFKNRTADFEAEREKAEKKALSELNAAPDSVKVMSKVWSFKKWEEVKDKPVITGNGKDIVRLSEDLTDTLAITNYKGVNVFEVVVPEKIGKRTVTVIGNGAFAAASGIGAGSVTANFTHEQMMSRRLITKITLPKTIKFIGRGAFTFLKALKEIEIPEGVEMIAPFAFDECSSLTMVTIPGSVKKIGKYAFASCRDLTSVKICEGVLELGAGVFSNSSNLTALVLPKSLKRFETEETRYYTVKALTALPKLTVYCHKGSAAERYCIEQGIRFKYISEE